MKFLAGISCVFNGIYRYVAWGYEWRTGKHLPNIFQVEEEVEMDYAKFVKNYYRYATKTIKKYREGSHSMCDKFLNPPIPNIPLVFIDEDASVEYSSTMSFKLIKEDAPTEFIIEFMSFYSSFHPGLLPIYTHEEDIKALFDKAKKLGFLEDDEKMMKYIELVVESYAKALEEQYILEPRKRRNNYDR